MLYDSRENFLSFLLSDYIFLNELLEGPHSQASLRKIGIKYGLRVEEQYRQMFVVQEQLSVQQLINLIQSFFVALNGESVIKSSNVDKITLWILQCPFRQMSRRSPAIYQVFVGIFGGIAARNFTYSKVNVSIRTNGLQNTEIIIYCTPTREAVVSQGWVFDKNPAAYLFTRLEIQAIKNNMVYKCESVAVCMFRDVAEKKILENELQMEKFSLVAELAAGTAHEIRNPMTTLRGFLQLLSKEFKPDEKGHEYCALMIEEIDRANAMIKEFLLLTKRAAPKIENINLHTVLDEIFLLIESKSLLENVKLEKDYEQNRLVVYADPGQIKQVFLNLASNAIQAMPHGGKLKITTSSKDNKAMISFTDTGHGIPEAQLLKIFDPFFTTKENGTGLGLAISYRIIERHGGRLSAESSPGKGTTLFIEIPLAAL